MLFVAACATSDDAALADDDAAPADDVAADGVVENTAPGPVDQTTPAAALPAPSLTMGGSSTLAVTTSLTGAGLQLDGGFESASYAIAFYGVQVSGLGATAELTVNPAAGASFTYALRGTGGGYSSRYLRLQRVPGSDQLQAVSTHGAVNCGALPSGRPTAVTLSFDGATQTFDVLIAGASTPCTNLPTAVKAPVTGFRVTDETIVGYGGHVAFTGLALFGT